MIPAFTFSRIPRLYFGGGVFREHLISLIEKRAQTILIVTGSTSFRSTERWWDFTGDLSRRSITWYDIAVRGEPSPELVDKVVSDYRDRNIELVISIGGGSVIDAGKAISAMLTQNTSVNDFLEGVGTGVRHSGDKIPFIAVPTTAGTGSEATTNAVLSHVGKYGFKKSLRHDNFVPDIAVIDPELMLSCPPAITASCGMDAFTQLLESYVSTKANPMSDALALSGLTYVKHNLLDAFRNGQHSLESRAGMAYAAYMSGITLTNAGLGIVHGLASPIGGYFGIPHGVVCGTLMGPAVRVTIRKLKATSSSGEPFLEKYAKIGALVSGTASSDTAALCSELIDTIDQWTKILCIPQLRAYGITGDDFDAIIDGAGNKNNPAVLDRDDIREILLSRL